MSEMAAETEISREDQIIAHFVAGRSVAETAALLGVSVRTIHRDTQRPLFAARLAEARAQRLQPLVAAAENAAPNALQRLIDVADDPTAPASARVRAAVAVLDVTLKLHEAAVTLPRLTVLEAMVDEFRRAPVAASDEPTKLSDLLARLETRKQQHHPEDSADDS